MPRRTSSTSSTLALTYLQPPNFVVWCCSHNINQVTVTLNAATAGQLSCHMLAACCLVQTILYIKLAVASKTCGTHWLAEVARAAPATPMPKPKMSSKSRHKLITFAATAATRGVLQHAKTSLRHENCHLWTQRHDES